MQKNHLNHIPSLQLNIENALIFELENCPTPLQCEVALRILPDRRLTVFAQWGNQSVVAKLFFHRMKAKWHFHRELRGYRALKNASIQTPPLLFHGKVRNTPRKIFILIFEKIEFTHSIDEIICSNQSEKQTTFFQHLGCLLANMHLKGLYHSDLHRGNFLIGQKGLYLLDTGAIRIHKKPLSKRLSVKNLSLLQLNFAHPSNASSILQSAYLNKRKWTNIKKIKNALRKHQWQYHKTHTLRKLFRNSSQWICGRDSNHFFVCDKTYYQKEMMSFLYTPDRYLIKTGRIHFDQKSIQLTLTINDHSFLIQGFRDKCLWQRLKSFKCSPAAKKWYLAHYQKIYDQSAYRPIALTEQRNGLWNSVSFLVLEPDEENPSR